MKITHEILKENARKVIHAVHKADKEFNRPFVDDEDYESYLWRVSAELFKQYEQIRR